MHIFDIFNSNGKKVGEIHNYEQDGCFGYLVGIILFLAAVGGGFASWYLLFTLDDFQPLIVPVVVCVLSMALLAFTPLCRTKSSLSFGVFMGLGIITFTIAMCIFVPSATSSLRDFLANFILGAWFSIIPAGIFHVILKLFKNI